MTLSINEEPTMRPKYQLVPSRASLLGFPVELRLQIYEEVLPPRVACLGCSEVLEQQTASARLLRSCKRIFAEAMPVYYNHLQLYISLPLDYGIWKDFSGLATALRKVPPYAQPHIKSIILIGSREGMLSKHLNDEWQWEVAADYYCRVIGARLPSMTAVTLRGYMSCGRPEESRYAAFGALATLPAIRKVEVDFGIQRVEGREKEWVFGAILERAKALEKVVEVVEI